jgi:hypothetical protein
MKYIIISGEKLKLTFSIFLDFNVKFYFFIIVKTIIIYYKIIFIIIKFIFNILI